MLKYQWRGISMSSFYDSYVTMLVSNTMFQFLTMFSIYMFMLSDFTRKCKKLQKNLKPKLDKVLNLFCVYFCLPF